MLANVITLTMHLLRQCYPGMTRPQLYPLKSHYAQIEDSLKRNIQKLIKSSTVLKLYLSHANSPISPVIKSRCLHSPRSVGFRWRPHSEKSKTELLDLDASSQDAVAKCTKHRPSMRKTNRSGVPFCIRSIIRVKSPPTISLPQHIPARGCASAFGSPDSDF